MRSILIAGLIAMTSIAGAGEFLLVYKNGIVAGQQMVRTLKKDTYPTDTPIAPNELTNNGRRFHISTALPAIPDRYHAWDGIKVIEPTQVVKDAVDAKIISDTDAAKDRRVSAIVDDIIFKSLIRLGVITRAQAKAAIKAEL